MAGMKIPCPKCDAPLKLPDRSLLGKMAKCPRCGHKFVLREQSEIELELVESPVPVEGKNATWVPDAPLGTAPVPPRQATPPQAAEPLASLFQESAPTPPPGDPLSFLHQEPPAAEAAPFQAIGETAVVTSSPARRRKRRRSSGGGVWAAIAILLAVAVGGGLYYRSTQSGAMLEIKTTSPSPPVASTVAPPPAAGNGETAPRPVRSFNPVTASSPTSGKPIQLLNMPAGVRLVINLHPAQLWSNDRQFAEFRASLGPLGAWLETQITELAKQPPQLIEEMLIGIILGPRGTAPEVAAVVHFAEPQQRAELLRIYNGTPHQEFSTDVKINNGFAYRIVNDKTVAICPELYVEDLATFQNTPAMTSDNLQEILKGTDRERLVSVVFDPNDLEQHRETLFPAEAGLVVEKGLRWLGEDVWAAAWSVHVAEDFHTELLVRGQNNVGPISLSKRYQERLDVLPELLLTAVQKMNPQRSGYRQIIGRFPAMLKVLSLATAVGVDGRFVRLGTLLPPKAAPNLALGTLLTWDESTRTDFTEKVQVASSTPATQTVDKSKLPLQERLQLKFDVEFRRTPLQEAFAYIAGESKIPIDIDGDALKLAGFTKNMPQTFTMEQATTLQAIYGIIKTYEKESSPLAIYIDEEKNEILVLTTKVAEDRGLKTYDFKANGFQ
ncbi:MAG: hypothetical protein R3C12_02145 [Planctomycetaceae bacterium]|nr:hypothetical protein [Planctomycetaceae bacterium]